MAEEQKQPIVLALGRGFNGFYCPETRFHLVGTMKPRAVYTAPHLSEDVKRGLRSGVLVDINKVIDVEALKPGKGFVDFITSADRKKDLLEKSEESLQKQKEEDKKNGVEKEDYLRPNLSESHGELLSEPDVLTKSKKDLIKYIEDTEGLDLDALGLTTRSTAEEVRDALLNHFGYNQKPVDASKVNNEE